MLHGSSREHDREVISSLENDGPKDLLRMPATSDMLKVLMPGCPGPGLGLSSVSLVQA